MASTLRGSGDPTPTHGAPELRRVAELGFVRVDQLARECGVSLMPPRSGLNRREPRSTC